MLTKQQINAAVSNTNVSVHNFDDLLDIYEADENDILKCFNKVLSKFKIKDDKSIAALLDMIIIGLADDDDEYGEGELACEQYFKSRAKAYEIREYATDMLDNLDE